MAEDGSDRTLHPSPSIPLPIEGRGKTGSRARKSLRGLRKLSHIVVRMTTNRDKASPVEYVLGRILPARHCLLDRASPQQAFQISVHSCPFVVALSTKGISTESYFWIGVS